MKGSTQFNIRVTDNLLVYKMPMGVYAGCTSVCLALFIPIVCLADFSTYPSFVIELIE